MRGLKTKDHDTFITGIKETGYSARKGFIAESWTGSSFAASKYAGNQGGMMICSKYKNRKRIDASYPSLISK